jgi:purine-binding chemotaxis protein CheW
LLFTQEDRALSRQRRMKIGTARALVACEVGEVFYALPVEQVQEIIQPMPLTALPHAPPGVVGAVEHRDLVVPILDLGERLGYGPTTEPRRKWVLLRGGERSLGIVVKRVHEVIEVFESQLRPAPDVGDAKARSASHVISYRGTMAFVLDIVGVARLAAANYERPLATENEVS